MKTKGNLFICILLGIVFGWLMGYLRFPFIEKVDPFLFGVITSFISIFFATFLYSLWNRNRYFLKQKKNIQIAENPNKQGKTYRVILISIITFIFFSAIVSSYFLFQQNRFLKSEILELSKKVSEQVNIIASLKSNNNGILISAIIDDIVLEKKINDTLSNDLISRIAGLSFSFKPYKFFGSDSLSETGISPERGQLLLTLVLLKIDSLSFEKIKQKSTFTGADLGGAQLKEVNLSNADLKLANFKEADLSGANLSNSNLIDANFWGANLDHANLNKTDLKRADLSWAVLNDASIIMADLNGAKMINAQFIHADLSNTKIQWADLSGAIMQNANLALANLMGSHLMRTNLKQANLTRADLRLVKLDEGILSDAELNIALVDSTWFANMDEWQLNGSLNIKQGYQLKQDTVDQWKGPLFRLYKGHFQHKMNE